MPTDHVCTEYMAVAESLVAFLATKMMQLTTAACTKAANIFVSVLRGKGA